MTNEQLKALGINLSACDLDSIGITDAQLTAAFTCTCKNGHLPCACCLLVIEDVTAHAYDAEDAQYLRDNFEDKRSARIENWRPVSAETQAKYDAGIQPILTEAREIQRIVRETLEWSDSGKYLKPRVTPDARPVLPFPKRRLAPSISGR